MTTNGQHGLQASEAPAASSPFEASHHQFIHIAFNSTQVMKPGGQMGSAVGVQKPILIMDQVSNKLMHLFSLIGWSRRNHFEHVSHHALKTLCSDGVDPGVGLGRKPEGSPGVPIEMKSVQHKLPGQVD
jgi:hypothetical protein